MDQVEPCAEKTLALEGLTAEELLWTSLEGPDVQEEKLTATRGVELGSSGTRIGDYFLEAHLGEGGFGAVYAARHEKTGRRVAVKFLRPRWTASTEMVLRLFREAEAIRAIGHPNIVEIYDWGWLTERVPAVVMELLEGTSLLRVLEARGAIPPAELMSYVEPMGQALIAAHRVGVIHRDLKASNVMVCRVDGQQVVKLIDFGIAKLLSPEGPSLTRTGVLLGTRTAISPEQLLHKPIDQRTDVYSLGVLLFHLLTGRRPFGRASAQQVEQMHLSAPPPRASHVAPVSVALDRVILRCMEKEAADRYPSVEELLVDLRAACEAQVGLAPCQVGALAEPDVAASSSHLLPAIALSVAVFKDGEIIDVGDLDDDALDELQDSLELIQENLEREGFVLPVQTDSEVIGCHVLEDSSPEQLSRIWKQGLDFARDLVRRLQTSSRFAIMACIDVGSVEVRRHGNAVVPQIASSDVLRARHRSSDSEGGLWASVRTFGEPLAPLDEEADWISVPLS
ncbi:MAG: serine/threonine protein kinase [Deltaproteobacteria bacterium]|nr:serine/threonine protein kinase [Deltaproteobacteria bacterium]